jgi:DNA-binding transcriptional LysR family regulator
MTAVFTEPNLDQLRGLRAFTAAARSLSFTRAASELEVSPQAVASAVARLESALGVRLLNRSTRSMALTEEGASLLPLALDALQRLAEAVQSAAGGASPRGTVRISVGSGFARRYLLPELAGLRQRFPDIQVELAMDDRQVDMVRDGFDIVIRGARLADASVVSRRICQLTTVLVASPAYLAGAGVPRQPSDLLQHRLISLRFLSGLTAQWTFQHDGVPMTLEPHGGLALSDPETVAQAALLGLGIGGVALHHALPYLRSGQLKVLLHSEFQSAPREVALQYPHRANLAPRVRAVVDHLLAAFEGNADLQMGRQDLGDALARWVA